MFALFRRRPSHAAVVAYVALFVALGGTAYASNEWTGDNIVDGSLTAADIKGNDLGSQKIKDHSLQAVDMAPGAIGATELAPNSVSSGNIVDSAITSADIATDAVQASEIADNSIDSGEIVDNSLTLSDLAGAQKDGSISFSANAVANGRCRDFVVSSSGSRVGDAVVLSIKGALAEGMLVMGVRVDVDNQAIMKLCNFTGGASPAINSLPVKLVTFR